jgi:hypothetical protein
MHKCMVFGPKAPNFRPEMNSMLMVPLDAEAQSSSGHKVPEARNQAIPDGFWRDG